MRNHIIRVTGRARPGGPDIERLARALLEFINSLTEEQRRQLEAEGESALIAYRKRDARPRKDAGGAQ